LVCKQLDAVSWKDERVVNLANDWFVSVRFNSKKQEEVFKKYLVSWTPTLVVMDAVGREHGRFIGFLPPQELCARIILEGAKTLMTLENFTPAIKRCNDILQKYQGTFAEPEAIFYSTVAKYLSTHEPNVLKEGLLLLRKKFPDSEWTLRAKPYELIGK
jgi:thioredoxin-related protein